MPRPPSKKSTECLLVVQCASLRGPRCGCDVDVGVQLPHLPPYQPFLNGNRNFLHPFWGP